jgi:hypothetical protein
LSQRAAILPLDVSLQGQSHGLRVIKSHSHLEHKNGLSLIAFFTFHQSTVWLHVERPAIASCAKRAAGSFKELFSRLNQWAWLEAPEYTNSAKLWTMHM